MKTLLKRHLLSKHSPFQHTYLHFFSTPRTLRHLLAIILLSAGLLALLPFWGGLISEAQSAPQITSLSPSQTSVGQVPKKITILGSGFAAGAQVEVSSSASTSTIAAKVSSSTQLVIKGKKLPAAFFSQDGQLRLVVISNGQRSNAFTFTIGNGGSTGGGVQFQSVDPVLQEGGTLQVRAQVVDSQGNPVPGTVTYESGSPEIATVDTSTGLVRGVTRGFATITARSGNLSAGLTVTVTRIENSNDTNNGDLVLIRDQAGRLYTSNPTRHIINRRDGFGQAIRLFAGRDQTPGNLDGTLTQALFNSPIGLSIDDRNGRIYVADTANHIIRAMLPSGNVITIAGIKNQAGSTDGPVTTATFRNPRAVEVDLGGNLYVADTENHTIRYIDFSTNTVSTIAGVAGQAGLQDGVGTGARFSRPTGLRLSPDKRILNVSDAGNGVVRQVTRNGEVRTIRQNQSRGLSRSAYSPHLQTGGGAFQFTNPQAVGVDSTGNVYVGDQKGVAILLQRQGDFFDSVSLAPIGVLGSPSSFSVAGADAITLNTTGPSLSRVTVSPPEITSITPNQTPIRTSVPVTIRGRNFAPESVVLIDGVPATDVIFDNATQLRVTTPANEASGPQILTVQHRGGIAQTQFTYLPPDLSAISAGSITTFIGGGRFAGDGGPGLQSPLIAPGGIVVDGAGNLLIADTKSSRIRKLAYDTSIITTIAGTGQSTPNFLIDVNNKLATSVPVSFPSDVTVDIKGDIYLIARFSAQIYKINGQTGTLTVVAGTGIAGFSGDGGLATRARFSASMFALQVDRSGNIFVVDGGNQRIRRISPQGTVTTIAGNGQPGNTGDNGPATAAAINVDNPDIPLTGAQCAVDRDGNFFFADTFNSVVRRIDARSGIITRVVGTGTPGTTRDNVLALQNPLQSPVGVFVADNGDLYVTDTDSAQVWRVDATTKIMRLVAGTGVQGVGGEGTLATNSALRVPTATVVDGAGGIFISDSGNNRVRKIDSRTQIIRTIIGGDTRAIIGDSGSAIRARLVTPTDVAVSATGNYFVGDPNDGRVRLTRGGTNPIQTIAGNGELNPNQPQTGVPANSVSVNAQGIDVAINGDLLIADQFLGAIWRVNSAGILSRVAGNPEGSPQDGIPALSAFIRPLDVAVDGAGNIYFSEGETVFGVPSRIRRIDAQSGILTTVAGTGIPGFSGDGGAAFNAQLNEPEDLAIDRDGNLFICDAQNNRIRRVDARTRVITTVAGTGNPDFNGESGTATAINLGSPSGLAIDGSGNLFISDYLSLRIRRVQLSTNQLTTIAGVDSLDYKGDGGPARNASLFITFGLAVDRSGNLLIADTGNNRVRIIKSAASPAVNPGVGPTGGILNSDITETEPNDLPTNAQALSGTTITVNGNVNPGDSGGTFIQFGDNTQDRIEDLYRITIPSTMTVALALDWAQTSADLDLYLFNNSLVPGSANAAIVDASASETLKPERIGPRILQPGTYYIGVSRFDQSNSLATSYQLRFASQPGGTSQTLSLDDGRAELFFASGTIIFANRLTPPSYPATLNQVLLSVNNRATAQPASAVGSIVRIIVYSVDTSGQRTLQGVENFLITNDGTTPDFTANTFNITDVTIQNGSFLVGYQVVQPNSSGVSPFATVDSTSPKRNTFISVDNGTTFAELVSQNNQMGNLLLRGEVTLFNNTLQVVSPDSTPFEGLSQSVSMQQLQAIEAAPTPPVKQLIGLHRLNLESIATRHEITLELADPAGISSVEALINRGENEHWIPIEIRRQSFDPITRLWTITVTSQPEYKAFRYRNQHGWLSNVKETSPSAN
ncbi:MAG: IPT/TIG domain-containing protein [Acidobacteria bacterium]|nr:IPT/TIG domain-containing protein [Acidobacteriota bacterium]